MTLFRAAPYSSSVIRPITAITCLALAPLISGCATDVVSRTEHAEVLSSLRALRAENARLEARLEKLEAQQLVASTRAAQVKTANTQSAPAMTGRFNGTPPPVTGPQSTPSDALPPLAVVKLKPRREAAPKIPTVVEVSEPPTTISDELSNNSDDPNEPSAASLAETQYEHGVELMKTGNSAVGITQLEQFVTDWPRHPRADNALYFTGLALMSQKDFEPASERFERVVAQYPAGDAVLDSMLKLAECRLKLNRAAEARATWQKIVTSFPGTSAAAQAQARLSSPAP
ncbi:MAG: tetratricopeptide repeat protein [Archangium sp.]